MAVDEKMVEELSSQVKSLQEKIDDTAKENEGLQSLIGKWSGEIGDIRKELAGAGGDEDLKKKLDTIELELKEMKAQPPQGGQPNGGAPKPPAEPSERKSPEELADELELSLDDEQKKLVEQAWNDLEDKSKWDDPKFRVAVYQEAKSHQSVPNGPWRAQKKEQPKPDDMKRLVKGLFENARKKIANVPPGSGGVGSYGDTDKNDRQPRFNGRDNLSSFLKSDPRKTA